MHPTVSNIVGVQRDPRQVESVPVGKGFISLNLLQICGKNYRLKAAREEAKPSPECRCLGAPGKAEKTA